MEIFLNNHTTFLELKRFDTFWNVQQSVPFYSTSITFESKMTETETKDTVTAKTSDSGSKSENVKSEKKQRRKRGKGSDKRHGIDRAGKYIEVKNARRAAGDSGS